MKTYLSNIPQELLITYGAILIFLSLCTVIFKIILHFKPGKLIKSIDVTTGSWWFMTLGAGIVIFAPKIFGTVLIAYISFVALREMFSISGFREADRTALFSSYFAIPIQYYLVYTLKTDLYFVFIPIAIFIAIPFLLVIKGKTNRIGRSMSIIPTVVLLTVFMISHIVLLFNLEISDFNPGPGGLILFLVLTTALNDIFQFTWGKILGKRKILPSVSPNKTWEGFIGGVLSVSVFAYAIRFLTPFNGWQAFIVGLIIGVMGFIGDSLISAIKRDLHLKDTDDLIPGHGGAMDRLDSLAITAPVYYHLTSFILNHTS